MSDFKAKMHQIRFDSAPPDPLAGFKRYTSKGVKVEGKGGKGKGG